MQNKPTNPNSKFLNVLWVLKQATVREVHEILNERKPTAYTTVLKMLQIMTEKNLVERDDSNKAHVYKSKQPKETNAKKSRVGFDRKSISRFGFEARSARFGNETDEREGIEKDSQIN